MNTAYLILGSNLGNRESYLAQAITLIDEQVGKIFLRSAVYNTEPWGTKGQDNFLNQAIAIKTSLSATQLLEKVLAIEEKLGRKRIHKWEARTIDIDILFYNSEIVHTTDLSIPHPFLHERRFVLIPLSEIAENVIHPVLDKSVKELLKDMKDSLSVSPIHGS